MSGNAGVSTGESTVDPGSGEGGGTTPGGAAGTAGSAPPNAGAGGTTGGGTAGIGGGTAGVGGGTAGTGGGAGGTGGAGGAGGAGGGTGGSGVVIEPPAVWGAYDLGVLPSELQVSLPAMPQIANEVSVATPEEFTAAAATANTRIRVTATLVSPQSFFAIQASDVEVVMDAGVSIRGRLFIRTGLQRVALLGGRYEQIEMNLPSVSPTTQSLSQDVLIDSVFAETTSGTAIRVAGQRVAVLRSVLRANEYCVYSSTLMPVDSSEQVVIAGNMMWSSGDEATIRLVDVTGSATVENRLENELKHTYRVHGTSTHAFAARNTMITAGVGFGFMPADAVGTVWFNDNTLYHRTTDLFNYADQDGTNAIAHLTAQNNVAFTDFSCMECYPTPEGWVLTNNTVDAYVQPPAP